jgi:hypothetical protein
MGAVHDVGGGYYGPTTFAGTCAAGVAGAAGNTCSGHPDEKLGFAVGAGIKVNFPMIGPGDYLQAQVNYTVGAERYAALTPAGAGSPGIFGNDGGQGSAMGLGFFQDGVYCGVSATGAVGSGACPGGPTSVQLTTAWSVQAAYEHFWTPSLRTSLVGAYTDISYNGAASAMMCANTAGGGANTIAFVVPANCGAGSFDWSHYSISSRTQWNITKDFYVGLEGYYGHLNTMSKGQTVFYSAASQTAQPGNLANNPRTLGDQNVWVYRMRVHRDLVP